MHQSLTDILDLLRQRRGFDTATCIAAKVALLKQYFQNSSLKSVVIGVSGGVDSAVALALMTKAKADLPLDTIVAALLPYFIKEGTTNQQVATERGRLVAERYGAKIALVDLSSTHKTLKAAADQALMVEGDEWAAGQLVSYLRTPALFYLTSLMTQLNKPALLVGTTNRDEGGYIGYFGKAADAMVDLQILSDLHKSEVYALARALAVPDEVIAAAPSGDIYDGRTDEQLIGVPYEFIELYSLLLSTTDDELKQSLMERLSGDGESQFAHWQDKLDRLNRQNAHKYASGSVAIHLDVYERAVPGGWRQELDVRAIARAGKGGGFVNPIELPNHILDQIRDSTPLYNARTGSATTPTKSAIADFSDSAIAVQEVLSRSECQSIHGYLDTMDWTAVGQNGMLKDYNPGTTPVGSYRATLYSQRLADYIYTRLTAVLPAVRLMSSDTPADHDGAPVWRWTGVSPVMRFIKYHGGGLLVPHYDAPFDYYDGKRTLMSVVVYITSSDAAAGGATRFIRDPQSTEPFIPPKERDYSDWTRLSRADEVLASLSPQAGTAIILDHRVLHDSEELTGQSPKIIMRTDLIFERCGIAPSLLPGASKPLGLPDRPGVAL